MDMPGGRTAEVCFRHQLQHDCEFATHRLVMVNTAVHTLPFDLPPEEEMAELWFAVVRHCS